MNTETFTTPSPELKQHAQDLHRDANLVAQDIKNQASAGLQEIKTEAHARLREAKGSAADFYDCARSFTAEHPLSVFGAGFITGIVLATWHRK
jgi:hypothetical protein